MPRKSLAERHKIQALSYHEKLWKAFYVEAREDHVAFTLGYYCKLVRYDVSDDEWKKETGWG